MQKDNKQQKSNQINQNLEKRRRKRNKGKTDIEEREQKRLVFKRKLFFQQQRARQACKDMQFFVF